MIMSPQGPKASVPVQSIISAHLQFSVLHYPKIMHSLYMKNGKSDTPLSRARKPFILELSDSAEAFVDRSMK